MALPPDQMSLQNENMRLSGYPAANHMRLRRTNDTDIILGGITPLTFVCRGEYTRFYSGIEPKS